MMDMQEITTPEAARLPVPALVRHSGTEATVTPDAPWRHALATELDLAGLRKLRFEVKIAPIEGGFQLNGKLGATVAQPCVVTLEPVTTRIDVDVTRSYLSDLPEPTEEESEIPEDDSQDALGSIIDLEALLTEALALNLPLYPRSPGAALEDAEPEPGPEIDEAVETTKPFAGLGALRDKLAGGSEETD